MPCKGYVKAYLLLNFRHADPDWPELVNLSSDKALHDYFLTLLRKSEQRNDCRLKGTRYRHHRHQPGDDALQLRMSPRPLLRGRHRGPAHCSIVILTPSA